MPIPAHGLTGVLPPFIGGPTDMQGRSPYAANLVEVVDRFATTPHRAKILHGFLAFRDELRAIGIADAIQWINGGFLENDPTRDPKDVDVVTIFIPPSSWADPQVKAQALGQPVFDHHGVKARHLCDTYFIDLAAGPLGLTIRLLSYWYGVFSHRRVTYEWKGMLEAALDPTAGDAPALAKLQGLAFP